MNGKETAPTVILVFLKNKMLAFLFFYNKQKKLI
jgi:hypothetical protein